MLALSHGLIEPGCSVLDYGCGRGDDVRYLCSLGIPAKGWDPHFNPETKITTVDIVNLGYVLNVIEDPLERQSTLLRAFELARRLLIVAVRVDHSLETGTSFSDGLLTRRGSFQKLYQQSEFKEYLERVLGRRPHVASLGIAYIFKDDDVEARYLISLAQQRVHASRTSAIDEFSSHAIAQKFLELAATLGRPPVPNEFPDYAALLERFGSSSRIEHLTQQLSSPATLESVRQRRREDILMYNAMMRLQGLKPVPFRALPPEISADIRMLWSSYSKALQESEEFLFQIGKADVIRASCQESPVGKKLSDALYIHRSAEEQIGTLLRMLVFAARQVVGEVDYNVLKIHTDGKKLSFLLYQDFDCDPHPALAYSVRVFLPRAEYSIRTYTGSENPPILHRKEMLVDPIYPRYEQFRELSRQEEALGLLSRSDIGRRQEWLTLLAEKSVTIEDYAVQAHAGSRNGRVT